jgi:hypothetical protein
MTMREFTKSMMSYGWAMSVFGLQQMANAFNPSRATESFDNVTEATRDELGDALRAAFRAGDNLQRGAIDLTFGVFTLGMFDGRGAGRSATDAGMRTGDAVRQGVYAAGRAMDGFDQATRGSYDQAARGTGSYDQGGRGSSCYDQWTRGGSSYGGGNDADRQGYDVGRQGADLGRQAADAVGQGMSAMGAAAGAAADAMGQTMQGAAYYAADAAGQAAGRGADAAYTRSGQTDGAAGRQTSGGSTRVWGAAPARESNPRKR